MNRFAGLCLLLALPLGGAVQARAPSGYDGQVVRCESRSLEWVRCEIDTDGEVELVRQLSEVSCIRGSDWGVDKQGVWVVNGCGGEFRRIPDQAAGVARPTRRVVRCESNGRPQSCPVALRGAPVRVLRQTSSMPCRKGHSWDYRRNEIWVTRGCEAEFEVGAEDGSGFLDVPRSVTCESKRKKRRFCGAGIDHDAVMVKQLSGKPCEQGVSWGWNSDGVWVDRGCHAQFKVH